jgi:hypothetical protein
VRLLPHGTLSTPAARALPPRGVMDLLSKGRILPFADASRLKRSLYLLCRLSVGLCGRGMATSGRQRIRAYKLIDEADRIDDWLYLPKTLYAFILIIVISAGAGPYSLDAVILSLIDKRVG